MGAPIKRLPEIDVVRGLALFGICVVNVPFMAMPMVEAFTPPEALGDQVAAFVLEMFFQGKFFVLFSFLFGWGFAVQLASAERRGIDFRPSYRKRLLGLLVIGTAHALLVFFGDILVLYAVLGLALPWVRNWRPRALLRLAAGLVGLAFLALGILAIGIEELGLGEESGLQYAAGYEGGWWDSVRQRAADWPGSLAFIVFFNGPMALACFSTGLAAAKSGFFERGSTAYATVKRRFG